MVEDKHYQVYAYRWVVLLVSMFVNLTIQILWISFAPVTSLAAQYYGVTDLQIGLFAMIFMIAFIPLSLPVSWALDTFGFHKSVGLGVILMAVFAILRGLAGTNYNLVLVGTIGIAMAQPFLLNSWTTIAAKWFPRDQRAGAVSLITVSNLIGTALGMILTPMLLYSLSLATIQLIYGIITAFSSLLFVLFARETPPTPPCPEGMETRAFMLAGFKHVLTVKRFWLFLVVWFCGNGIFNGILTWIENIIRPRGFNSEQAGVLGALFLAGGVVGAFILSSLSDKQHKRQRYLLLGLVCSLPGLLGITFASNYLLLIVSAFAMGFFMVSLVPVGLQYSAEVTYPTPEGTSNGVATLFGQASVVVVYLMEAMKSQDGSFTPALLACFILLVGSVLVTAFLKDANLPQTV